MWREYYRLTQAYYFHSNPKSLPTAAFAFPISDWMSVFTTTSVQDSTAAQVAQLSVASSRCRPIHLPTLSSHCPTGIISVINPIECFLLLFISPIAIAYSMGHITRHTFCGTWYLPHSHVHNERTVPITVPFRFSAP